MVMKLRYIFNRADKWKLVGLAFLMILGSLLELLAVAVFNPFIEVMMQTENIQDDSFLRIMYQYIHFDRIENYLVLLSVAIAFIYLIKNIYLTFLQNKIL